jgi:PAS domain S-box-containing protein
MPEELLGGRIGMFYGTISIMEMYKPGDNGHIRGKDLGHVSGEVPEPEWLTQSPFAAYTTDAQGFIQCYNEAAANLWGRQPEIGKDRWVGAFRMYTVQGEPLPPEESPMSMALAERRAITGREIILERPDGTRRLVVTQPKPIFDETGLMTGAVNILVDLTDVKSLEGWSVSEQLQTNSALKKSEERYHKMIAEVEDYAILLLDDHGIIQNWNVGAEKIKGYKEAEIVGKHFRVFYIPEDREAKLPEKLIAQASQNGKAIHEGWRQRKDGSLFWGSIVITALHEDSGKVIGFSKVTRDLTARRVAEEKLKRYSQDLEFQNRELQQFAYAAAHDLKEPLRKLRFYGSSLAESLQGKLSSQEQQYFQRSTDAAIRMQRLIDDLLSYSRASSQGGPLVPVDLQEIVAEAQDVYQDMIEETNATIEIVDLPVVWGIAFQLRQLFENLLGNALKYRDSARPPVIRIQGTRTVCSPDEKNPAEAWYQVTVTDNGIGFDGEKAAKIFDIFQRLDNHGKLPGTGIGLAIVKRVVQNHRGFISAAGETGAGASFTIYLPVEERPVDEREGE